jgi:hypothetical protein
VIEDAPGKALEVGRKLRVFSGALRRALHARDGHGCRFLRPDGREVAAGIPPEPAALAAVTDLGVR